MDIFLDRVSKGPIAITIKINSICNLKCEFCWVHSPLINNNPPRNILPLSCIKKIIKDVKELSSINSITLSAEGEISLHPKITEIIDFIKEKGFFLQLNSNLTFDKDFLRLSFAKADKLLVNICAHDENVYSKLCHPSSKKAYHNLIRNLKLFSALRITEGKPDIMLNCVITRNNYSYLEAMLEFADSLNIPRLRFVALGPTPYTKKLLLREKEFNAFKKIIKNVSCSKYRVKAEITEFIGIKENNDPQLKSCFAAWLRVLVASDGSIIFCHRNTELKAGNLKNDSLKNIWFSKKAHALRLKLKYDLDSCRPPFIKCRSCDHTKEYLKIENACEELRKYYEQKSI
ncbi:MAG: radical SAM protein [Candidatus Omnitrophota bacterium]